MFHWTSTLAKRAVNVAFTPSATVNGTKEPASGPDVCSYSADTTPLLATAKPAAVTTVNALAKVSRQLFQSPSTA